MKPYTDDIWADTSKPATMQEMEEFIRRYQDANPDAHGVRPNRADREDAFFASELSVRCGRGRMG